MNPDEVASRWESLAEAAVKREPSAIVALAARGFDSTAAARAAAQALRALERAHRLARKPKHDCGDGHSEVCVAIAALMALESDE